MQYFAVERERFDLTMRLHEDRAAGRLVHAARFHTDETILNEIDAADAMFAAEFVERLQHAAGREFLAVHRDAIALHEVKFDVFGLVRRILGRDGKLKHALVGVGRGVKPRVFQNAGLVGNVEQVAIHRIRLFEGSFDGDFVLSAVSDHLGATREKLTISLDLPRGDDLKLRRERHVGELETALVVALAGGAVRDGVGFFFLRDVDLGLGDERTRDGGAEVILTLVDRVGADHRVNEIAREFFHEIERVVF